MKTAVIIKADISNSKLIAEYLSEKCIRVLHCTDKLDPAVRQSVLRSDMVIIDKYLPGDVNGLELARSVKISAPRIYCIVCIPPEEFQISHVLHYDINAYLSAGHSLADLVKCIETIREGYRYVCPLVSSAIREKALLQDTEAEGYDISEQEMKVLQMMISGMKTKDIANKLYISVNTLNNHKTNIRNKLKLHSNRDLLLFALRNNIVNLKHVPVTE
jgi:DNA-binding NarL/FixJ family response regulator